MDLKVNQQYASLSNVQSLGAREPVRASSSPVASAVKQISNMPCKSPQSLAVNVLKFMKGNIKFVGAVEQPKGRDACEWSGKRVIEEGNFNGCVEAVKAFQELFDGSAKAKGFSAKCEYVSSFNVNWATPENINSNKDDPPGHAMARITTNTGSFLLDATRFDDATLGSNLTDKDLSAPLDIAPSKKGVIIQNKTTNTDTFVEKTTAGYRTTTYLYGGVFDAKDRVGYSEFSSLEQLNMSLNNSSTVTPDDLINNGIIKQADKDGIYYMDAGKGPEPYKIFNGIEFKVQKNPLNKFDTSTSNGATRSAMRDHIISKK